MRPGRLAGHGGKATSGRKKRRYGHARREYAAVEEERQIKIDAHRTLTNVMKT